MIEIQDKDEQQLRISIASPQNVNLQFNSSAVNEVNDEVEIQSEG